MTDQAADATPLLETPCDRCEGKGGYWNEWRRRHECNGAGHVPTQFGARVLALMRHNFRPMPEDARGE